MSLRPAGHHQFVHILFLSASHRSGRPHPPQFDFAYRLNVYIAGFVFTLYISRFLFSHPFRIMFRPATRVLLRAPGVAVRGPASRRLISTAPPDTKSRSWKSTVVRLGLAAGAVYYYNTSSVFAEQPSCMCEIPVLVVTFDFGHSFFPFLHNWNHTFERAIFG
jgi:hypothetical protein